MRLTMQGPKKKQKLQKSSTPLYDGRLLARRGLISGGHHKRTGLQFGGSPVRAKVWCAAWRDARGVGSPPIRIDATARDVAREPDDDVTPLRSLGMMSPDSAAKRHATAVEESRARSRRATLLMAKRRKTAGPPNFAFGSSRAPARRPNAFETRFLLCVA